jgi:molybdate transport system substrate-binding protein
VSTAISLKEALFDIAREFEKTHKNVHIVLNGASSGELALQIKKGAPVDIFVSASPVEMKMLKQENLLDGAVKSLAYNRLVVVTRGGTPPVKSLNELTAFRKIAIGNTETVPAGRYAGQALSNSGLFDSLQGKHALIFGQNAKALLTYVEQGNADASLVYMSDALTSTQVSAPFVVPKNLTDPIEYEIACIARSEHKKLARDFFDFATSAQGAAFLAKHHFEKSWN